MQKKLYMLVFTALLAEAGSLYNTMSFQGMTGVINTPNAEIISDGLVELQFSNQVDFINNTITKEELEADQYFVTFGLLPNLEVSGRLTNIAFKDKTIIPEYDNGFIRDLSASFKYQIPYYHDMLPKIAIGINDLGGQASHYDSKYIVATKEYGFIRGSVGYGFDSINLLDGAFGSLEVKATDWASLLAEFDSKDTQVGLRLNTPTNMSDYVDVAFLAKANMSDASQRFSFGVNVRMELGDNHHDKRVYHDSAPATTLSTSTMPRDYKTEALKEKLVQIGLENIDIKEGGDTIYLAYENNIFEHNELDAIGVVLGAMYALNVPYKNFDIVIKRSNQKVKKVSGSLSAYKAMIRSFSDASVQAFRDSIAVSAPSIQDGQNLTVENANSSYLKTRLRLYPGLITYVGTEYGTFDYLVSLRTALHWNLYKGFDLGVLADFPAIASDDLDRDTGRYKSANKGSRLNAILLHRSDVFGDFINIASAGLFSKYWAGFENLSYVQGNHTLGVKYAYFRKREGEHIPYVKDDYYEERYIYVANYSYYYDRYDTALELTAGKFFNDDRGFEVKAKRFFGDTSVGFFYQKADEQYIGINVEIPLTPRKVQDSYFQIKGKRDYSYGLRTTVNDPDGRNTLAPGGLLRANREFDIESNFLNRNRLSSDNVKKHVLRLRDAYVQYVLGE